MQNIAKHYARSFAQLKILIRDSDIILINFFIHIALFQRVLELKRDAVQILREAKTGVIIKRFAFDLHSPS